MRRYTSSVNIEDFDAVRLAVASSDDILDWSHPSILVKTPQPPGRGGSQPIDIV